MFKNTAYLIALLLVTIAVNAVITQSMNTDPSSSKVNEQLGQVLQGIQQQSTSISTLESNLKQLNTEVSRLDSKTTQLQNQAPAAPTAVLTTTPATAPIPEERLTKLDKQLADLQQQLAALLANSNSANDSPTEPASNPYAGMTPEQIEQQQALANQQQQQLLQTTITATADPGKTSQISSSFESYLTTAKIEGAPPRVDCGATLCRFQFNQATMRTSTGEEMDPMLILMESGTFPSDGTQRTIITEKTPQGGMDLYVGNATDFPKTPAQ
ncbi:hypothetical protein [Thiothrix eikelboomii]|uniref:hypothetical protein n=1 Tax=Thiothrix eikelboomii TaxID=92487 RepID=UPI003BAF8E4F